MKRGPYKRKPVVEGLRFVPCGLCRNGWVDVWERREGSSVPVPAMQRCPCWAAHQARIGSEA